MEFQPVVGNVAGIVTGNVTIYRNSCQEKIKKIKNPRCNFNALSIGSEWGFGKEMFGSRAS